MRIYEIENHAEHVAIHELIKDHSKVLIYDPHKGLQKDEFD